MGKSTKADGAEQTENYTCSKFCNNEWQRCPICNGEGIVPAHGFTTTAVSQHCKVCQGKMIISRTNGRPPIW